MDFTLMNFDFNLFVVIEGRVSHSAEVYAHKSGGGAEMVAGAGW
jgi:hypothetical protein